jgi:hypothetical protein
MNVRNERQPTLYPVSFIVIKKLTQDKQNGSKRYGKPALVLVPLMHLKELMMQIGNRDMENVVKHSHIPVFLKDMNEVRNPIKVSNVGMPPPFPVLFFAMSQSTLDYNAIHVHHVTKHSHISVLLQNTQN